MPPITVYHRYFLPKGKITKSALDTHKLTLEKLKEKNAKEYTREDSQELAEFLNREPNLPIVAHNVRYDRDSVLKPAFEKVGDLKNMPRDTRWVCTIKLADSRYDLVPSRINRGLDSLLEYLKLERREPGKAHEAMDDCIKTAHLYMKLTET